MITIKDRKEFNGKETFTVCIDDTEIKNCKVADGAKGPFISGPGIPPKAEGGKWFNPIAFSNHHSNEILQILRGAALPEIDVATEGFDDSDIPF